MKDRHFQILQLLANKRQYTLKELAREMGCSQKTVWNSIQEINDSVDNSIACISSRRGHGNGVSLEIYDKERYMSYVLCHDKHKNLLESRELRSTKILWDLVHSGEYIRLEDMQDEYFLSVSQLSSELKSIRTSMAQYDLEIVNVPHYGMKVEGAESNICKYLAYMNQINPFLDHVIGPEDRLHLVQLEEIVSDVLQQIPYMIPSRQVTDLVHHLYILCYRNKQGIKFTERDKIEDEILLPLMDKAQSIVQRINVRMGCNLNSSSVSYIAALLHSKLEITNNASDLGSAEARALAGDVLNAIDAVYHLSLHTDFNVLLILAQHFTPLLTRIKYRLTYDNPLLDEIKAHYIYEYELAGTAAEVINKTYNCRLSEDEIGYIAINITLSLNRRLTGNGRSALIVSDVCLSHAELLKQVFLRNFREHLAIIDATCNPNFGNMDMGRYNYIFTTVPFKVETAQNSFIIKSYLSEQELSRIRAFLMASSIQERNLMKYFPESLFLHGVSAASKDDLLDQMIGAIKRGKDLPKHFKESVLKREHMANTSFGNRVAFPHPNAPITDDTFCCVAVLKKSIYWNDDGRDKVRVVFLASIEKGSQRKIDDFYAVLSDLMASKEKIDQLIRSPNYYTLLELLQNNR